MKICLLVCDHVAEHFVTQHGSYPDMFRRIFPKVQIDPYFVCDGIFPDVREFDFFIATGSKASVYEPQEWIYELSSLIQDIDVFDKRFVGVCFGHQMIAQALGGKVNSVGWNIGIHNFDITSSKSWMDPSREQISIPMLCQDQITELPAHTEVLAQNEACPYAMIQIGERFLGIQGHPEFTKNYAKSIYDSRIDKIGTDRVEAAKDTLHEGIDAETFSSWTMRFFES